MGIVGPVVVVVVVVVMTTDELFSQFLFDEADALMKSGNSNRLA